MTSSPGMVVRVVLVAVALVAAFVVVLPDIMRASWVVAYGAAGGILIVRRPRNAIGWLLALIALSFTGLTDLSDGQVAAMEDGSATSLEATRIWIGAMSGAWAFLGYALLGLVFPSGRLPDGRWRRPTIVVVAVTLLLTALSMVYPRISVTVDGGTATRFVPNPFAVAPGSDVWAFVPDGDLAFIPVLGLLVVSIVSVVVRARRSTGLVRLQMRWLAAAFAGLLVALTFGAVLAIVGGSAVGDVAWLPASIAFLTVPVAILVAVLRYRLLDIDRLISRTLGWGLATGVLAMVFLVTVASLQTLLVDWTQGDTVAVAASTLLAAACFQPLRRRLQHAVDRRFDRAGEGRDRILATVSGRLRDEVDLTTIQEHVLTAATDLVRPTDSTLWLRVRGAP